MKYLYIILFMSVVSFSGMAQDFNKALADARSAYGSGNLTDARFAMEQMLRELDVMIGKEIMKLLPTKMDALNYNPKEDKVTGSGGGIGTGLYVQRTYGDTSKYVNLDIINNSPMINSINAILAMPFIGNSSDGSQKTVKVQGYKAVLYKNENTDTGTLNYDLQIPLNNTLVTLKIEKTTEGDILRLANTIPLAKIAQMAQ